MAVEVYVGDAGLDTGRPQNIFVLDQSLIASGQLQKAQRLTLEPGEEARVDVGDPAGPITVRFDGAAEFANYQISRDPFQRWALVATMIMLAALAASLTIKRRRVWVRLHPETTAAGEAVTRVEIAGLARTDRAGWGSEFDEVVGVILGTHDQSEEEFEEGDL